MIQEQAPDFSVEALLPGLQIGRVALKDYHESWVLLFFYPLDFTFVCPTEIISFADRHAEFAALNCQVLAASCDSVYTHMSWSQLPRSEGGLGKLSIPLLADFNKELANKYNVLSEGGVPLRATFLIAPGGVIRHLSMNDLPVGRSVDESLRVLQAFQFVEQHGEVCPANWKPGDKTMKADVEASKEYFSSVYDHDGHEQQANAGNKHDVTRVSFANLRKSSPTSASLTPAIPRSMIGNCVHTVSSSLTGCLEAYTTALKESPLLTKALTSCVIGLLGELIGTYIQERKKNPSECKPLIERIKRLAVFGVYGLAFTGPFFHWWYGYLEKTVNSWKLSPNISFLIKLALNQLAMTPPFLLFTLAYLQYFFTLDAARTVAAIKNTFVAVLLTNWKVWTVAQAINFKLVPLDYRVLFGNVVALWWNIFLSLVSSS